MLNRSTVEVSWPAGTGRRMLLLKGRKSTASHCAGGLGAGHPAGGPRPTAGGAGACQRRGGAAVHSSKRTTCAFWGRWLLAACAWWQLPTCLVCCHPPTPSAAPQPMPVAELLVKRRQLIKRMQELEQVGRQQGGG